MKPGKSKPNGIEILIAEDSRTQAAKLRQLLEEHGYTAVTALDGKQALAAARRRKPTLVISDVMMPELDGYGLCKAIKSDDKLKDVLVILVTALSDSQDVIRGLECGADNFVRKPYDERYLLSRIEHLLMNREMRKSQKMQIGVEIELGGHKHFITSERQQILDLLISTYEQAVEINRDLAQREKELAHSNQVLLGLNRIAEGLNRAVSEREVAETALERALELPGVQAGWISLWDRESGFRLAAARNLPPALSGPGAFDDSCTCRRKLLSGELDNVTNVLECERLEKAKGDTKGLRHHASVPLWLGNSSSLGVMNLAGPGDGLFSEDELKILYGVGNQVAVALERARLHEHLEKLVAERTATLEAEVVERKRAEDEVRALSVDLERRVEERTRELAMVNKELESFSHSVSHDLRAPLRHIDGYIQMLAEHTAGTLSSEARRYLEVITDAGRKMGKLIDDLLEFSRMGRAEMRETGVELDDLVREVVRDLEMATAGRNIAWQISSLPRVVGDPAMLKQVLANLLSNAVKFPGPRDVAEIEVGVQAAPDEIVLFVRDNGVGFDMQYAARLFGVFQRLHRADEFEGTGIGLANVQRIIARHGGRVWAEAVPDRGATFYFALQSSPGEQGQ